MKKLSKEQIAQQLPRKTWGNFISIYEIWKGIENKEIKDLMEEEFIKIFSRETEEIRKNISKIEDLLMNMGGYSLSMKWNEDNSFTKEIRKISK